MRRLIWQVTRYVAAVILFSTDSPTNVCIDHILQKRWAFERLPSEERRGKPTPVFKVIDPESTPQKKRAKRNGGNISWDAACYKLFNQASSAWKDMKSDRRIRAIMEKVWVSYVTEFNIAKHYEDISEQPADPADKGLTGQEEAPEDALYSLVGNEDDY